MSIQKNANTVAFLAAALVAIGCAEVKPVWMPLFDGRDLAGWGFDPQYWQASDGLLQGQGKAAVNIFCHTNRKYSDFVLSVKARLWQTPAGYTNSGLQYRSDFIDSATHRMKGYQVDIGDKLDGAMFPEGAYPPNVYMLGNDPCKPFVKPNDWNHYLVTANGGKVRHELNGNFCLEYNATVLEGYIGLQLHATSLVMKVDFKDLYIRPLNNSFTIPDTQATTLDEAYSSTTGIAGRAPAVDSRIAVNGRSLYIPASFWSGNSSNIRVTLNDLKGRTVFSRPVRAEGTFPTEVSLPALEAGRHVLSITEIGNAYSQVITLAR
jgi:hypothetical protein